MDVADALQLDEEIRCGVRLLSSDRAEILRHCRRIEALGFDSLWVTDHLAFHVPMTDSLSLLAFAAAATERMTLGTSVLLLPLREPALVAKQVATLDRLSEGRTVLGVGLGGEYPPEFEAVGVPVRERGARLDEAIPLLRRLWSEAAVAHSGRHYRFDEISIEPRPIQMGGPPIWVGGRAPGAMERAGRLGDGYISHMATPEHYAKNLDLIATSAEAAGRQNTDFATAAFLFTWIDSSVEAAEKRAAPELEQIYAQPFGDRTRKYCLLGPPEVCLERLESFVKAGGAALHPRASRRF